jgi:tyrosyl-tRNA synthetase
MNNSNILSRRVEKVLPNKEALESLIQEKKIRLYQGFDPTGGRLHLGHTIGLRKLMEFAKEGHEVIFLFGTGTVLVGDPSERDSGRKLITTEEIDKNIQGWKDQVSPVVDFNNPNISIKQNGDWLIKMTLKDIIKVASNISAIQLFKRDSFTRRLEKGDTVWYHETMYPLLQGYDSVVMDVDLEIGGTDQEFNMLIGRELQRKMNNREKFVLTVPMIMGTDGNQMSKTSGNCIWLDDSANEMFGKVMSIPDSQLQPYWELLTDMPISAEEELLQDPMNNKKVLAFDITRQFHGDEEAKKAQSHFESTVQSKEAPQEIEEISIDNATHTALTVASKLNLGESNSERKRVISQGGFYINNQKIIDPQQEVEIHGGEIVKFGKRQFKKIKE